jgi:hypothetical protein
MHAGSDASIAEGFQKRKRQGFFFFLTYISADICYTKQRPNLQPSRLQVHGRWATSSEDATRQDFVAHSVEVVALVDRALVAEVGADIVDRHDYQRDNDHQTGDADDCVQVCCQVGLASDGEIGVHDAVQTAQWNGRPLHEVDPGAVECARLPADQDEAVLLVCRAHGEGDRQDLARAVRGVRRED